MAKILTALGIAKLKPQKTRREIPDGGCVGLYLVIQPSGARSWALRFRRPNGKPAKMVLGSVYAKTNSEPEPETKPVVGGHLTLSAVHTLATQLRHEIAQHRDPAAAHIAEKGRVADAGGNTFAAIARDFIDQHKVRRTDQRPRGWREIARILGLDYPADGGEPTCTKGGLVERWADRPIGKIDGHDVHAIIVESVEDGIPGLPVRNDGPSDNRGRKMGDALGSLFKWALRHRRGAMSGNNPTLGVYRPNPPAARERVLTGAEIRRLWSVCDATGAPFGAICQLLLLTGARLNEIARLEWGELNEDNSIIALPGKRTKNSRPHTIPLPPMAREILAGVKRIEGCNFVFSTNGRSPVSGWSKTKNRLDAAMKIPAWRLHDLRRTCATGMADLGIPPHIVEACLNHTSGAKGGVAGTYNRAEYADEKRGALKRWASHVAGIVSGQPAKVVPLRARP